MGSTHYVQTRGRTRRDWGCMSWPSPRWAKPPVKYLLKGSRVRLFRASLFDAKETFKIIRSCHLMMEDPQEWGQTRFFAELGTWRAGARRDGLRTRQHLDSE